jgi:hypothetical protein
MKKIFLLLLLFTNICLGQVTDTFNYNDFLTNNGWTTHSGTPVFPATTPVTYVKQITTTTTSLNYNGICTQGNKLRIVSGNTEDINLALPTPISTTIYYSAIINVLNTTGLSTNITNSVNNTSFLHTCTNKGNGISPNLMTAFQARSCIRTGSIPGTFNLGILNEGGATTNATWSSNYPIGTYFIVVKYDMTPTISTAELWINPTINIQPPLLTSTTGNTKPIKVESICIRQASGTGNIEIDEIRVGTSWEYVTNQTTWNGSVWSNGVPTSNSSVIIDGNYNTSNPSPQGSFDACSVTVNSGKNLTINSNQYIKIQNELVNGTGNVIVEDGGSIVQVNDNVINTGNITYKRKTTPVTRFDYTYWSTPVSPQTLLDLSPNTLSDKYYRWNFSIPTPNWVNVVPNSNMSIGMGYIIRAPQPFDIATPQIYEAIFSGVPNNGVYNVAIGSEYTLIGNPYPSAISADMLITNYPGTLYFWTHNTPITNYNYTGDDYAVYTLVGGVGTAAAINTGINNNTPNGKIAAGQGFFFKNTSTSTNIIFNNSLRLTNNNNQFFRTSQEKARFWLEMTNDNGLYKQILIGYVNGATNNIDGNYDGEILEAGNIISLYTIVDDKLLTIQGRQYPFNIDDSINLGYKTNINGDFKIKLSDVNGLFTTQNIYLQDLYSNTIHDLRQSPYTFNSVSGTFNDRFILRYTNNSLGNNDFFINNTIIYNKDNKINIDSNKIIKNVKVYDITGKLLYDNNFNLNNVKINLECSKQILFIKIKTEDEQVITRKILND